MDQGSPITGPEAGGADVKPAISRQASSQPPPAQQIDITQVVFQIESIDRQSPAAIISYTDFADSVDERDNQRISCEALFDIIQTEFPAFDPKTHQLVYEAKMNDTYFIISNSRQLRTALKYMIRTTPLTSNQCPRFLFGSPASITGLRFTSTCPLVADYHQELRTPCAPLLKRTSDTAQLDDSSRGTLDKKLKTPEKRSTSQGVHDDTKPNALDMQPQFHVAGTQPTTSISNPSVAAQEVSAKGPSFDLATVNPAPTRSALGNEQTDPPVEVRPVEVEPTDSEMNLSLPLRQRNTLVDSGALSRPLTPLETSPARADQSLDDDVIEVAVRPVQSARRVPQQKTSTVPKDGPLHDITAYEKLTGPFPRKRKGFSNGGQILETVFDYSKLTSNAQGLETLEEEADEMKALREDIEDGYVGSRVLEPNILTMLVRRGATMQSLPTSPQSTSVGVSGFRASQAPGRFGLRTSGM